MTPIEVAHLRDAAEILSLQKQVYLSEARLHDDYNIPPLHQSMQSVEDEFRKGIVLKLVREGRIIASVRAYQHQRTCFISKLIVDPVYQNQGLGRQLIHQAEHSHPDVDRFELFTGHKSTKSMYLYQRLGYEEFSRHNVSEKLTLIYFQKQSPKALKTS
jgi:N-acetylglutamate synthase-like GNAT family acetyltransferase